MGDQLDELGHTGVAVGAAARVVTHPPALQAVTITVGRGLVRSGTRGVPRLAGVWGPVLREPNRRRRARARRLWRGTRGREGDAKITTVGLSFRRKHTTIPLFLQRKGSVCWEISARLITGWTLSSLATTSPTRTLLLLHPWLAFLL